MNWKPINIIIEKLKIGYILRIIHGAYFNKKHPDYNLFTALALKSGLPGSKVFKFTTDGQEVTLFPMGQHLDQHGSDEITDTFIFNITKVSVSRACYACTHHSFFLL
ncbi:hypothetical protein ES705_49237 [subsurface metagenome]